MKKRGLSILLVLALILSLCSSALAADFGSNIIERTVEPQINPLYADLIPPEYVAVPESDSHSSVKYASTPCESIDSAGQVLRDAMLQRTDSVSISVTVDNSISPDDVYDSVFEAAFVHNGIPTQGDYLRWQYYTCSGGYSYSPGVGKTTYNLQYNISYFTTLEQENELSSAVSKLLAELKLDGMSDYNKIKTIYDYLCNNISYDYETLYNDSYILKYSAYAALINKTAVCQGYASLLYRLLLTENIDCRIITSANHAWNIVKLGDVYYNLDSTFDAGYVSYRYFLIGENSHSDADHVRETPYNDEPFFSSYPTSNVDYTPEIASHAHSFTDTVTDGGCEADSHTTRSCSCGLNYTVNYVKAPGHNFVDDACIYCGTTSAPRESDVYAAMIALKDTYPEGMPWTNDDTYAWNGSNLVGGGCVAFAFILSDAAFGDLPARSVTNCNFLRVGDIIRAEGHSAIILEVHRDYFVIAEGNYNSSIHWGREIQRDWLSSNLESAYTRYRLTENAAPTPHVHSYTDSVVAPTCTQKGYTAHVCACGDSYSDNYVNALGHVPTIDFSSDPTCTDPGYTGDTVCSVCRSFIEEGTSIPALGHDYKDGVCGRCGKIQPLTNGSYTDPDSGITYTLANGVLTVSGKGGSCNDSWQNKLEPAVVTKLVIEDGVSGISNDAFADCTALMSVSIPNSVTAIGNSAFHNCTALTSVIIPNGITAIENYTFYNCAALKSVTLPAGVTSIGMGAFYDCNALTDVYFGGTVEQWNAISIDEYNDPISAANIHCSSAPHTHSYTDKVTAATCTEKGYTTHTCDCGDSYRDNYTAALGHNYKDGTCTRCGEKDPGYQPPHTHAYSEKVTAPTCTEKGYTTHTCSCGDSYKDNYTAALGHDTELRNVKIATCTAAGYSGDEVCKTCGKTIKTGSATAALGHNYKDGVCTVCGAKDPDYKEPTPAVSFTDVADKAYYAVPVAWAVEKGITGGYPDNTFKPMNTCTRAQIVTFIWRAMGSPEPAGTGAGFTDVPKDMYYYKAVLWASENGITSGFDDGGFHPDELVTRAQAMTFLWRAEGKPAVPSGTVNTFVDVPEGAYYHDAVLWAVANGVTGGYDSQHFGSMDGCTRAQIVTFLYRNMA